MRAYNGQNSSWYEAAMRQKAGQFTAAGIMREAAFAPVEGKISDRIDQAYGTKYKGSPYLSPMIGARALRDSQADTARDQSMNKKQRTTPLGIVK
jgi:hypothetical protein